MDKPAAVRSDSPQRLSFLTKLAFGAGDLSAMTINVQVFFLLRFLTDVAGLPPGLAGNVLMLGKISDAVNDPIVGMLSDRTRSRWGRRHVWMIFGGIPFGIIFLLQWVVPDFEIWGLFWFYVAMGVLFNLAYTAVNLPYTALTPELTDDYDERTSLNSFRFAFSIGGSIISLLYAGIIIAVIANPRYQYLAIGAITAIASTVPLYLCVWGTRARVAENDRQHSPADDASLTFLEQLRVVFSNRAFLFVVGIYLCAWLAVQVTASVLIYFVEDWIKLPPVPGLPLDPFSTVALTVQGTAIAMLFVWSQVSNRFGKQAVFYAGAGIWAIAQVGIFLLRPETGTWIYPLAMLAGCGVSTAYLVPWSLLPDVIDLDELQTGQRREGIFYAFMVLLQKVGLAAGLFLVGQSLEWAGYRGGADVQPDLALLAIRFCVAVLPAIFLVIGVVLTYFYPISREIHAQILLQLKERELAAASDAQTSD
ncbi:sugar (glycoside-Pentoside-Hexuronide) transporter [Rubidibacter lacunae KORDI 51-2]|uniref:Sugar (Glycoside-Pentoside-Hexuronide) transporter n=1 Tax=Rubidibacter lacunae KORDI 51-2 TaxID=582515 RepID=U5DN45_9CHRO|nr:MFS transporter [Rubidibacter lacunae]ERN42044.1 sugar (glycoside-Pentoside-Hexuronide) transporter [Rubidibacter lacunae KORDI 51-2]